MIRAILLEVERLHSHLLNLGLACHFTGFDSGFMQFFPRARNLDEDGRDHLPARVKPRSEPDRRDPPRPAERGHDQTRQLAQQMRRDVQELVDMLLSTPNMEQRTVGGRLDPEIARDFSNVGRWCAPAATPATPAPTTLFVGYGLLPMEVHSEQGCDVISRLKVRINEVYTALNMIDFGLDNLPGGPLMVEGVHPYSAPLRAGLLRGAARRRYPLEHDRRQPETVPLALPGGDLRQLADPALYAARQHRFRCAADHRQPRPVLLLY